MDRPWSRHVYPTLDKSDPDEAARIKRMFSATFAEDADIPYFKDRAMRLTELLKATPYSASYWLQRAQALASLQFPNLALGDAYRAYLLLRRLQKERVSVAQSTSPGYRGPIDDTVTVYHLSDDRHGETVCFSGSVQYLKALCKLTMCELLMMVQSFGECSSMLEVDKTSPWPANLQPRVRNLETELKEAYEAEIFHHICDSNASREEAVQRLCQGTALDCPLPWMDPAHSKRSQEVQIDLAKDIQIRSDYKCTLGLIPNSMRLATDTDCNGIFALVDLPSDYVVLLERTTLAAVGDDELRCTSCRQLRKTVGLVADCCSLWFCSYECKFEADRTFHEPIFKKCTLKKTRNQIPKDMIPKKEKDLNQDMKMRRRILERILQTAAKRYKEDQTPPLRQPFIQALHPYFRKDKAARFSFAEEVQYPLHTLEDLDIDIFANHDFDTWVVLNLVCRIRTNVWDDSDERKNRRHDVIWWEGLSTTVSLLNHSCRPNVEYRRPTIKGQAPYSQLEIVTNQPIPAGTELCITYLSQALMHSELENRQAALGDWCEQCRCDLCKEEKEEVTKKAGKEAKKEKASKDVKGSKVEKALTEGDVIATRPASEYVPSRADKIVGCVLIESTAGEIASLRSETGSSARAPTAVTETKASKRNEASKSASKQIPAAQQTEGSNCSPASRAAKLCRPGGRGHRAVQEDSEYDDADADADYSSDDSPLTPNKQPVRQDERPSRLSGPSQITPNAKPPRPLTNTAAQNSSPDDEPPLSVLRARRLVEQDANVVGALHEEAPDSTKSRPAALPTSKPTTSSGPKPTTKLAAKPATASLLNPTTYASLVTRKIDKSPLDLVQLNDKAQQFSAWTAQANTMDLASLPLLPDPPKLSREEREILDSVGNKIVFVDEPRTQKQLTREQERKASQTQQWLNTQTQPPPQKETLTTSFVDRPLNASKGPRNPHANPRGRTSAMYTFVGNRSPQASIMGPQEHPDPRRRPPTSFPKTLWGTTEQRGQNAGAKRRRLDGSEGRNGGTKRHKDDKDPFI